MPDIATITLRNFKGAEDVTLDLSRRNKSPVITLIGLNESGKTTILEGLSYFVSGDNAVSSLFSKSEITTFVPVHRKAAFTGEIEISAEILLDELDYQAALALAKKHKLHIAPESFPTSFKITRSYPFEDSVAKESESNWDFDLRVRAANGKEREYKPKNDDRNLWDDITNDIEEKLPRITYFPTFLVDMPSRIYLREHKDERPVNRYYRYVFQDILDSLNENLSLEKHVCKRIEDFRSREGSPNWFSTFFGGPSKQPIDSLFQKMSSAVTREVLGSWRRVFQRAIAAKSISVEWSIDTLKGDLPYASFVVSDGESRYSISERSLGFRWFFSFLLFTGFKQASKRATIFLFDEPAANLHAKAQAELLTSFARIVSGRNRIVYSTHSHHMINPRWLSGAYIVENSALDYDSDDAFGLTAKPTKISATNYRHFLSQFPNRTSYFQPVIEKLEYVTPEVVGTSPFVVVEGITDFYVFKFVESLISAPTSFSMMPGVGASASGPILSQLLGRGEQFILLLDDDGAGKRACKTYREEWHLSDQAVITLADVDEKFSKKKLEGLVCDETIKKIMEKAGTIRRPTKKQIGLYFSELYATSASMDAIGVQTKETVIEIIRALEKRFSVVGAS